MKYLIMIRNFLTGRLKFNPGAVFIGGEIFSRNTNVSPSDISNVVFMNLIYLIITAVIFGLFWKSILSIIAFTFIFNLSVRFIHWVFSNQTKPMTLFN